MFDESNYSKNDLKTNPAIQAGSPEYKLIDSEYWNIIVPVPDATAESLKDDDTIKIRFFKRCKKKPTRLIPLSSVMDSSI